VGGGCGVRLATGHGGKSVGVCEIHKIKNIKRWWVVDMDMCGTWQHTGSVLNVFKMCVLVGYGNLINTI
jgi:hypothetical protein